MRFAMLNASYVPAPAPARHIKRIASFSGRYFIAYEIGVHGQPGTMASAFSDSIARMKDPWGRPIYWIGGGSVTWTSGEGTDADAVRQGYISVTPLHLDITHEARLDDAGRWWKAP